MISHSNLDPQAMKVIKALSAFIGYLNDDQAIELTKAVCAYVAGIDTYEFSSVVIAAAYDEITEVIDKARDVSKRRSEVRKGRKSQEETQDLSEQKSNKTDEMSAQEDKSEDLSQQNSNKNEDLFNFCHDKNVTNVSSSSSLSPTPPITLTTLSSIPPIIPQKQSGGSPRKEKVGKKKGQENSLDPSTFGFDTDPALRPVFLKWLAYKNERSEVYKPIGLQAAYTKLRNYSKGDPEVAMEIIVDAMGNNSQGFFKPRWSAPQKPQQMARQQAMNPNERYNDNDYHGF